MSFVVVGVGVGGAALAAGATVYSSQQQAKASKQAANTISGQKLQTFSPYSIPYSQISQVNPGQAAQYASNVNQSLLPQNENLSANVNQFNYGQAAHYYSKIQPYFQQLQDQMGKNALAAEQGQLPPDVVQQIGRLSAQQGIQGGIGFGSQGSTQGGLANLTVRNLGLNSLQQQQYGNQLGMQLNAQAKGLLPNMMSPTDMMVSPQSYLQGQEFNAGAVNQVNALNAETINQARGANASAFNALNQNAAQAQAAGGLASAQITGQATNQIAGLLGQYASNQGLGVGSGGSTAGNPAGMYNTGFYNSAAAAQAAGGAGATSALSGIPGAGGGYYISGYGA